jgi:hypothetical protein
MASSHTVGTDNDINLVESWLTPDPTRWIAGIISGLIAAAVAIAVGMILSVAHGYEIWFPVKLLGTILVGPGATDFGSVPGLIAGLAVWGIGGAFWGFAYAQFTRTNSFAGLLGMGVTWGLFTWIFEWNLFMRSFRSILAADIPSSAAFPVCLAFGVALVVLGFVDRALRGRAG